MPTRAQVETSLNDALRILDEFLLYCSVNGERFTGSAPNHEATFRTNLLSDFTYHAEAADAIEGEFRGRLNGIFGAAAACLLPGLKEYAKVIDAPERDADSILGRLYDDFVTNSLKVKSRQFTFGTPAAGGGNVGNGAINRLKKDENNFDMEAQTPDAKVAECVADEHSGASRHEEVFEFRGQDANRDLLVISGSGKTKRIKALSARDSLNHISNPSFSEFTGSEAVPTAINGWTVALGTLGTNFQISNTIYRDFDGDAAVPRSLQFLQTASPTDLAIEQTFSFRRVQIRPRTPIFVQVAVFRQDSGTTGNFIIQFGNTGLALVIALSTLTAGAWNVVRFATGLTPGGADANWYRRFGSGSGTLKVRLEWNTASASKHILVDDLIISPFTEFDGDWYAVVGGSTKFKYLDKFTWSDTATEAAIIQKWLWRTFGRYLPHGTGSAITWADPT